MIYQEVRRLLHLRSAWTASGLYIYWFLIKFTPLKMNGFGPLNLSLIVGTCQDSLTGKSHNGFDNAVFSKNQKELKNQNLIYRSHLSHFSTIFILMWFWRTTYILSTFFTYRYWLKRKLYSLILLYIAAWEWSRYIIISIELLSCKLDHNEESSVTKHSQYHSDDKKWLMTIINRVQITYNWLDISGGSEIWPTGNSISFSYVLLNNPIAWFPYHTVQPQHDYHFSISQFPMILKKNVSIMSIMQQSRREIQMIIKTEDNCLQRIQNDVCTQIVTMIVIFIPSGVEYWFEDLIRMIEMRE